MTDEGNALTESQVLDLVARYPLPEGVVDCVMTREELAEAVAVSLPTITEWIGKGMPVKEMGGQGRPYQLVLSHCWAWRQAWKAQEDLRSEQVKRTQAAMRLALVGGSAGDSEMALDPKTRREILAVQIEQERFQRERNELLRRGDVSETFDTLLGIIRDTMESAPTESSVGRRFRQKSPTCSSRSATRCSPSCAGGSRISGTSGRCATFGRRGICSMHSTPAWLRFLPPVPPPKFADPGDLIIERLGTLRPALRIDVPTWAESSRRLSTKEYQGLWRNDFAPYMTEPSRMVTSRKYRAVVLPARRERRNRKALS